MVNDVAVSADKEFIVAGMDNNMVAIWRREPEDDEDEEDMDTDWGDEQLYRVMKEMCI